MAGLERDKKKLRDQRLAYQDEALNLQQLEDEEQRNKRLQNNSNVMGPVADERLSAPTPEEAALITPPVQETPMQTPQEQGIDPDVEAMLSESQRILDGSYPFEAEMEERIQAKKMKEEEEKIKVFGFWNHVGDMGKGVVHGLGRFAEETAEFGYDVLNFFDNAAFGKDEYDDDGNKLSGGLIGDGWSAETDFVAGWQPKTGIGTFVSGITQFAGAFFGIGKLTKIGKIAKAGAAIKGLTGLDKINKASKAGKALKYAGAASRGFAADMVGQDPEEARLSNIVTNMFGPDVPIASWLEAKEGDSRLEGRIKNGIEGLGVGALTDTVFSFLNSYKAARAAAKAGASAAEVQKLNAAVAKNINALNAGMKQQVIPETATKATAEIAEAHAKRFKRPLSEQVTKLIDDVIQRSLNGEITEQEARKVIERIMDKNKASAKEAANLAASVKNKVDALLKDPDLFSTGNATPPGGAAAAAVTNATPAAAVTNATPPVAAVTNATQAAAVPTASNAAQAATGATQVTVAAGSTTGGLMQTLKDVPSAKPIIASMRTQLKALGIKAGKLSDDDIFEFIKLVAENPDDTASKKSVLDALSNLVPKGRAVTDADYDKFANDLVERVRGDIEPGAFQTTHSVYNKNQASRGVAQAGESYVETAGTTRPATQTTTLSNEETVEKAKTILKRLIGENRLNEFMKHVTDFSDFLAPAMVLAHNRAEDAMRAIKEALAKADTSTPDLMRAWLREDETKALIKECFDLAAEDDKLGTAVARALQARSMFSRGKGAINIEEIFKAVEAEDIAQSIIDQLTDEQMMMLLRRASTVQDAAHIAKMFSVGKTGKVLGLTNEVFINSLLSGPATHMSNIISGAIKLMVMQPLSRMFGALTTVVETGHIDKELWDEGARAYAGLYHAFSDSWRIAREAFKLDDAILAPQNMINETHIHAVSSAYLGLGMDTFLGKLVDNLGKVVNFPSRLLLTGDEFMKQLASRSNVYTQYYSKAVAEFSELLSKGKITAAERQEFITKFINDGLEREFFDTIVGNGKQLTNAITRNDRALAHATEATWTKSLEAGSFAHHIQQYANKHPLMRRIVPFIRTPANIISDVFDHTPFLGMVTGSYRAALAAGGKEAAIANGKMLLGGMVWATAIMRCQAGDITGAGPKNPIHRQALLETGWRPNSIKIGDEWVSYGRLEPIASILGMAADFNEAWENLDEEDVEGAEKLMAMVGPMLFTTFHNMSSKTYMQGLSMAMDALNDEDKMLKFAEQQALSNVPAIIQQIRRSADPIYRETEGLMDEFKNRVWGMSESLPPKYSWLTGQPIVYHGGAQAGVLPVVKEQARVNTVAQEFLKLPKAFIAPQKDIGGVKLTTQQRSDYFYLSGNVKIAGKTMMEALQEVIDSPEYDKDRLTVPDSREEDVDHRYTMLDKVVRKYRMKAREQLFRIHPELGDEISGSRTQGPMFKAAARAKGAARPGWEDETDRRRAVFEEIAMW